MKDRPLISSINTAKENMKLSIFNKKKKEQNTPHFAVCGIIEIDGKVLLVRHTYGVAKNRILLPGGYVKENELPTFAIEREIFEETSVVCKTNELFAVQFKSEQWCAVFTMEYKSGLPTSDGYENSEILLLTIDEALEREDLTNMSREILKVYKNDKKGLAKSDYLAKSRTMNDYVMFGV